LKGIAGSIGAEQLASHAQTVEAAIRAGSASSNLNAELAKLGEVLDALIAELHRQLPPPPVAPAAASGPVDRTSAGEASRQLAHLLADSDVAAIGFLTRNSQVLRNTLGEHFREIETATEGFDFAAALRALQRAASDLEIVL